MDAYQKSLNPNRLELVRTDEERSLPTPSDGCTPPHHRINGLEVVSVHAGVPDVLGQPTNVLNGLKGA